MENFPASGPDAKGFSIVKEPPANNKGRAFSVRDQTGCYLVGNEEAAMARLSQDLDG